MRVKAERNDTINMQTKTEHQCCRSSAIFAKMSEKKDQ